MSSVYIHINKINNKKYVGISTYSSVDRRWGKEGRNYEGSLFYNEGISKFGWNNFYHLVLIENISLYQAQQIESRLIKELNLTNLNYGYNENSGASIKTDTEVEIIVEALLEKINNYNKKIENNIANIATGYTHTTNKYSIEFIFENLYKKNRINTELDCQRGYVWTEERQQGMWDTLLKGHRIPEIHVIKDGLNYDIIDGKQRLTTIIKILNNEIPFYKRTAQKELTFLFGDKTKIYFSDLVENLKTKIYNISITFAEYSDIEENELISLFRKLNASMSLTEFSKGIANNILIRTNFTRYLISHPALKELYSEKARLRNDDEKMLIRLALLIKFGVGKIDLQPKNLSKYYDKFNSTELKTLKEKIELILNKAAPHCLTLKSFRQVDSYFPIILFVIYDKNLNDKEIKILFEKIKKQNFHVKGENFDAKISKERYDNIVSLVEKI